MLKVPSPVLNKESYKEAWRAFEEEHFDLVIIGGGSVGAGAAVDAATRGLKVAVLEARDFAAGTSSRSSKMFHGGLRYLSMLDFKLVAEGLHERELSMSTLAPHLVKPLKFLFPLTHHAWERVMMFGGFTLYDLMGGAKTVPMQRHYTRKGALKMAPGLKDDAIVGGVRYYDTLVDDARHTMTALRTAAAHGAVVRSATEVIDFVKDGERVIGAKIKDTDTGATTTIYADAFINATGIWSDELQELAKVQGKFTVHTSKGVHLVVPKSAIEADAALTFVTEKSVLFVIPWGAYWIVGTTDTDWKLDLADPAATQADIDYILDELNMRVKKPLTRDDVISVYAGLRPLVAGESDSTTKLSRNHAVARVAPGLVSVAGGKYTTYRVIGKDAVDMACKDIKRSVGKSVTEHVPLLGADGYAALNNEAASLAAKSGLTEEQIHHLLDRYGNLIFEVLSSEDPALLETVPGAPAYLWAEVKYAVDHEGALHLNDIIDRRTRISMEYPNAGLDSAAAIADFVAPLLGWDDATKQKELDVFTERAKAFLNGQTLPTDEAANSVLTSAPRPNPHI